MIILFEPFCLREELQHAPNMCVWQSYSLTVGHLEGEYHGFCSSWCWHSLLAPPGGPWGPQPTQSYQSPRGPCLFSAAASSSLGY